MFTTFSFVREHVTEPMSIRAKKRSFRATGTTDPMSAHYLLVAATRLEVACGINTGVSLDYGRPQATALARASMPPEMQSRVLQPNSHGGPQTESPGLRQRQLLMWMHRLPTYRTRLLHLSETSLGTQQPVRTHTFTSYLSLPLGTRQIMEARLIVDRVSIRSPSPLYGSFTVRTANKLSDRLADSGHPTLVITAIPASNLSLAGDYTAGSQTSLAAVLFVSRGCPCNTCAQGSASECQGPRPQLPHQHCRTAGRLPGCCQAGGAAPTALEEAPRSRPAHCRVPHWVSPSSIPSSGVKQHCQVWSWMHGLLTSTLCSVSVITH